MNFNNNIPLDILKEILEYLDFLSKIRFTQINKFTYNNLYIQDFSNNINNYLNKIVDKDLKIYKFIKYLCVKNNPYVKDISWMTNLRELDASENCGIDQNGIKGLNLIKLKVYNNPKIQDVSWMTNLRKLDSSWNCGIDQNGIKGLNLIKLNVYGNTKIQDVSWMT